MADFFFYFSHTMHSRKPDVERRPERPRTTIHNGASQRSGIGDLTQLYRLDHLLAIRGMLDRIRNSLPKDEGDV